MKPESPSSANSQLGIRLRVEIFVVANGSTSPIADISVEVVVCTVKLNALLAIELVKVVDKTDAAIVTASDGIGVIAAELVDAVAELVVNAGIDLDINIADGVNARIRCPECIHSISPLQNGVRSWRPKNAAVWKSKWSVYGAVLPVLPCDSMFDIWMEGQNNTQQSNGRR